MAWMPGLARTAPKGAVHSPARDNAVSWAAALRPRVAVGRANPRPARQAPPGGPPWLRAGPVAPPGWRPAALCGSHVSRGCAGPRLERGGLTAGGAPSSSSQSRASRSAASRAAGRRCSWRLRSGQKAPGHGHSRAGLRLGLAPPAHARQRDDHDYGDDDDQNDEEHGPLLPATRATGRRRRLIPGACLQSTLELEN